MTFNASLARVMAGAGILCEGAHRKRAGCQEPQKFTTIECLGMHRLVALSHFRNGLNWKATALPQKTGYDGARCPTKPKLPG